MKQPNNQTNRDKTIALYPHISREDKIGDESNSIVNQKKLLTSVAKKMGFTNLLYFVDDGISGNNRDRKEFNRMLAELEKGYIGAVMVKDLSRFARDHIFADTLIEEFFPEHNIRLISISENLDTAEGEDEFTPFRNLMSEWYCRDISKKRRLTNVVKGNAGEPLSPPPYGYKKDPDNSKRWIVDDEPAAIVRRIYRMTLEGFGTEQIAAELDRENVLTPMNYWYSQGLPRGGLKNTERTNRWVHSTVTKILSLQEYCGDVINFKTYSKSYKLKKRIPNSEENMAIFKDVHEAIISRADWERVQAKRELRTRKKVSRDGVKNIFSGLLVCADCGHTLNFHINSGNADITYFNCRNYKGNSRGTCETTHYIRVDFLEQVVLGEIRRLMKYVTKHSEDFIRAAIGSAQQTVEQNRQQMQKELRTLEARDRELDKLFSLMYEDNSKGKIDDERFGRMSRQYTDEQRTIAEKIKELRAELDTQSVQSYTAESFITALRKYGRTKKLTQYMLNELIEKIEVFQAEKIDGVWQQRLRIHYHGLGSISIPEQLAIPNCEVNMNTRKGVYVAYSPTTA
ncbi:MAG: recombinase family protein [Oscillospiraceae bacterium]|nr:recombinase family protein [Oscillospiraceae bacterium]